MDNKENKPRRMGPPGSKVPEKPKDFKNAIKKLLKNLKSFLPFIIVSILLASIGAILSIIGPNKLSDLTDTISEGLIINQNNLKDLSDEISNNANEEKVNKLMQDLYADDFNEENISSALNNLVLSDQQLLIEAINNKDMTSLPDSLKEIIINDTTYNGIYVSKEDKIELLKIDFKNVDVEKIPNSIKQILFPPFVYKNKTISTDDSVNFIKVMSSLKDDSNIYSHLDKLPDSIKDIIKPKMDMKKIKSIGLFLTVLYLVSALFNLFQGFIMATISNNFARDLRNKISAKINRLPLKYFDVHRIGDILSRITNDVDTISTSMNQSFSSLVGAITLFIGSIIMMFITNPIMAISAIISSFIGFIFMSIILKKSQKYFTARQVELGKLNSHIEEIYSSHNIVKVYNGEEDAKNKFDKLNNSVFECNKMSQFLSGLMQPFMSFIGNFSYVVVCIVGASLVINGHITFGVIVAFMIYVRLFTSPLTQIAQGMTSLQSTAAASERVFEFLEEKEMDNEDKVVQKLNPKKINGSIIFDYVKFGYNRNELVIKNFNCNIKSGSNIAIVGPTGAGKTTIVNLLMKFYNLNDGDIKIDDISISDLTRKNIHDLFIMVLQDTWLFNGTIRDNIKYNKKTVSDKKIWEALEIVGIDHFVKSLPGGLDYEITDNDSISSGQRQLLTIARGMIKDAPLLILDEATSNVDTRTEELVQKAMDKLTKGRTSFIIAHRLSTIKNADMILVMKDGNIIEQGTHKQLIKQNGFYAELYNSQFQN